MAKRLSTPTNGVHGPSQSPPASAEPSESDFNQLASRGTISASYQQQQQELHRNPGYGVASLAFAPLVALIVRNNGFRELSDYGAGKQRLLGALREQGVELDGYYPYDPAFPEYGRPRPAPLVCCIDVLEHIEPDYLDAVLAELASITKNLGLLTIHTGPAVKLLPDGRNAHLIQAPTSWWLPRLCHHFEILHLEVHGTMGTGFWVLVGPRQQKPAMAVDSASP